MVEGTLSTQDVSFEKIATVCKYVVPEGYPNKPAKGFEVFCDIENPSIYLASIMFEKEQLVACGSRTAAVLGKDKSIKEAEALAERGVSEISGKLFHRKDIGTQKLISSRIKRMENILK